MNVLNENRDKIEKEPDKKVKLQDLDLLAYNSNELSYEDRLYKSDLLYQVIKENFTESSNIISMLYGQKHNIYENYNIVDGYIERKVDFSTFG